MPDVNLLCRTTNSGFTLYGFNAPLTRSPTQAEKNSAPRKLPNYLTAFRIRAIVRMIGPNNYNKVWVRSELGHWYEYYEGMFLCGESISHRGVYTYNDPVRIWPAKPSGAYLHWGEVPHNGAMYSCHDRGAGEYQCEWIQPYV